MSRTGDWMQTYSGLMFWPIDPRPDEIRIEDIAHALSNQCRFAGHCREFYSVAQHSVLVSRICSPEHALWGLLHDAAEAYLVDLPRPVKRASEMGWLYRTIEDRLMQNVCCAFGLEYPEPSEIKEADNVLLITEMRDLMAEPPQRWKESWTHKPMDERIGAWHPVFAELKFLERYRELQKSSTQDDSSGVGTRDAVATQDGAQ